MMGLALFLLAPEAAARVVPVAPVSRWPVLPAVQKRAARHVVVLELVSYGQTCFECVPTLSRVVVHDSKGIEEPRDVTPGGVPTRYSSAAAWEGAGGGLKLLLVGPGGTPGEVLYSPDGGTTWKVVATPEGSWFFDHWVPSRDLGGPVARDIGSSVRLGTAEVPFVLSISAAGSGGIWGIKADGSCYSLTPPALDGLLLGSDAAGERHLALLRDTSDGSGNGKRTLAVLDLSGHITNVFDTTGFPWIPWMTGWITPDGGAYVNVDWTWDGIYVTPEKPALLPSTRSVVFWKDGALREVLSTETGYVLGMPGPHGSDAWIVRRETGPTVVFSHSASGGLAEAFRDETRPRVSGVFAAESGRVLFLRSDVARAGAGSFSFALWEGTRGVPPAWDAVVLDAPGPPTLVHLDVDAAATEGEPVLFDPGSPQDVPAPPTMPPPPTSPAFFQTAPLMRFSLQQQLVVPASARVTGQSGASWRSDLVLRNPGTSPLAVGVRFLPNPATSGAAADASVTLAPRSIAVVPDALGTLFQVDRGSGALLLTPGPGGSLQATSRTYTAAAQGAYGMSVEAVDVIAAARPGFVEQFPAALAGDGFRTNFVSSSLLGEASRVEVVPSVAGGTGLSVDVPALGQAQRNDVAHLTGSSPSESGAFRVATLSGATTSGFTAIDDVTNDPCWVGPASIPGEVSVPAVVHADGVGGARFRTDLFLFNPDALPRTVSAVAVPWTAPGVERRASVTLAPGEARRVSDALQTLFGLEGVARVTLETGFPNGGVSSSSRTYTVRPDGATYGMLVPPLAASQITGRGETLEILGPTGGAGSRTNLSLVMIDSLPNTVTVRILDEAGSLLDELEVTVPGRGGVQLDDLFRARALGDGPRAALIRVTPAVGEGTGFRLAAYATTIDNGTNDSVYFPGRVAAAE